ncbi:hypothetical protein SAMN05421819_1059 [Bryocella elongata]|uniref:Uncharacterized protein n=1 Tax=Bryocella elongata TaxID=863522 RepID=A0A1H5UJQ2_9BACT|nr:hypothetical protein SAMN05421819_1059 [Bryocella elongata]
MEAGREDTQSAATSEFNRTTLLLEPGKRKPMSHKARGRIQAR